MTTRTPDELWDGYEQTLPEHITPEQRLLVKRVFYAGMLAMMAVQAAAQQDAVEGYMALMRQAKEQINAIFDR